MKNTGGGRAGGSPARRWEAGRRRGPARRWEAGRAPRAAWPRAPPGGPSPHAPPRHARRRDAACGLPEERRGEREVEIEIRCGVSGGGFKDDGASGGEI